MKTVRSLEVEAEKEILQLQGWEGCSDTRTLAAHSPQWSAARAASSATNGEGFPAAAVADAAATVAAEVKVAAATALQVVAVSGLQAKASAASRAAGRLSMRMPAAASKAGGRGDTHAGPRLTAAPSGAAVECRHPRKGMQAGAFGSPMPDSHPNGSPASKSDRVWPSSEAIGGAAGPAGPPVRLALPQLLLSRQAQPLRLKREGAGGVAEAGDGPEPAIAPRSRYRPYMRLTSTAIKISGAEPEDLGSGYEQRIARLLAAKGLELEGVHVRRGCIEVVVDARAWARARAQGPGACNSGCNSASFSGGLESVSIAGAELRRSSGERTALYSECAETQVELELNLDEVRARAGDGTGNASGWDGQDPNGAGASPEAQQWAVDGRCLRPQRHQCDGGDGGACIERLEEDRAVFPDLDAIIHALQLSNCNWTLSSADIMMPSLQLQGIAVRPLLYGGPGAMPGHDGGGWPAFDGSSTTESTMRPVAGPVPVFTEAPASQTAGMLASTFGEGAISGAEAFGGDGGAGATAAAIAFAERGPTVLPYITSLRPRTLLLGSSRQRQQGEALALGSHDIVRQTSADDDGDVGDAVRLTMRVMVQAGEVPEVHVRSQGRYLPITVNYRLLSGAEYDSVTGCGRSVTVVHSHRQQQVQVGTSSNTAADGSDAFPYRADIPSVLQCVVSISASELPSQPGLLLVEARRVGQVRGRTAVPVLLVDDPQVAEEVQDAADAWRGPPAELDDILCDLSSFVHQAPCALAYVEGRLGAWPTGVPSDTSDAPMSAAAAVVVTRVQDLGSHLLRFLEAEAGWAATAARLRGDLTALESAQQGHKHQPLAEESTGPAPALMICNDAGGGYAGDGGGDGGGDGCDVFSGDGKGNGDGDGDHDQAACPADTDVAGPAILTPASTGASPSRALTPWLRLVAAMVATRRYDLSVRQSVRPFARLLREEEELRDPAYQSFVAEYCASQMHIIILVVFSVTFIVCIKSLTHFGLPASPQPPQLQPPDFNPHDAADQGQLPYVSGESPYASYMPVIPVVAFTIPYAVNVAGWLLLPRPQWVRWVHSMALWRLITDTAVRLLLLVKSTVVPTFIAYHLGPGIWVGNAIMATINFVPTSTAIVLAAVRAPIEACLFVTMGAQYGIVRAFVRSIAIGVMMVVVNAVCHRLLRVCYNRHLRRRLPTTALRATRKAAKAE